MVIQDFLRQIKMSKVSFVRNLGKHNTSHQNMKKIIRMMFIHHTDVICRYAIRGRGDVECGPATLMRMRRRRAAYKSATFEPFLFKEF